MNPRVRAMTPADCDRVTEIRVRGWQAAYRDLIPASYLDALSVTRDAERRRTLLARGDSGVVNLVAEDDGGVTGWACHGPYRDGELRTADAELYAIYVDPGRVGGGIGRALLDEALRGCAAAGHARVYLWVLKGNARARRFYEWAGFEADGTEEPFEADGIAVPEVRYVRESRGLSRPTSDAGCGPGRGRPPPRGTGGPGPH